MWQRSYYSIFCVSSFKSSQHYSIQYWFIRLLVYNVNMYDGTHKNCCHTTRHVMVVYSLCWDTHACPCIVDRFIESESPFAPATVYGYHAGTVYNNKTRAKKDLAYTGHQRQERKIEREPWNVTNRNLYVRVDLIYQD